MTLQAREKRGGGWTNWRDVNGDFVFNVRGFTDLDAISVREKPSFVPGFFSNGDKLVQWWSVDLRPDYPAVRNWTRVEVKYVDLD